jgi:hypothetical protein
MRRLLGEARMRVSTILCVALVCVLPPVAVQAQTALQEFPAPLARAPDAQAKPPARAATQRAMVKAMQRGRLKAANFQLQKLMYYEAVAARRRRTDVAKRLKIRIREQRATIRSISNAM